MVTLGKTPTNGLETGGLQDSSHNVDGIKFGFTAYYYNDEQCQQHRQPTNFRFQRQRYFIAYIQQFEFFNLVKSASKMQPVPHFGLCVLSLFFKDGNDTQKSANKQQEKNSRKFSSLAIAWASFAKPPNDDKTVSWLKEQSDFFVHPSLIRRASGDYFVREGAEEIKESELLMVIPASAIVAVHHDEAICNLFDALRMELELKEESDYAPYLEQLVSLHSSSSIAPMPSTWSFAGRSLLTTFNVGAPADEVVKLQEEYMHCLTRGDPERAQDTATSRQLIYNSPEKNLMDPPTFIEIPSNNRAVEFSPQEKADLHILEMTLQHQIERQFLVPLYDQMDHHHFDFNVVHQRNGGAFHVIATRSLKSGEMLTRPSQTCLKDCDDQTISPTKQGLPVSRGGNLLGALKLFGQVQRYPHVWEFGIGVSFVYHGVADDLLEDTAQVDGSLRQKESIQEENFPSIEWLAMPTEDWQLEYMEAEILRQRQLIKLEMEPSIDTVPPLELHHVRRYSNAVLPALNLAVQQGRKFLEQRNKVLGKKTKKVRSAAEKADRKNSSKKNIRSCDPLTDCRFEDIEKLRGCTKFMSRPPGGRDASEWQLMQTAYVNAVGAKNSTIPSVPGSGFRKKYQIAHSPGRGRGVFAMEDIPKGTLLWTSNYTAYFEEGNQFRRFLAALPDDVVCDLLLWCYTIVEEEQPLIGCDLDAGSLMNSYDTLEEYNAGTVDIPQLESDLISTIYAMRDIKAGEEMVTAYDEFDSDNYGAFGL